MEGNARAGTGKDDVASASMDEAVHCRGASGAIPVSMGSQACEASA